MMHDAIGPCLDRMQLERIASGGRTDEKQSMHLESCRSCRDQVDAIRNENDFLGEIIGANTDLLQTSQGDQHEVDGYRVISEIHRGGQGIVYEAEQISTRRTVAIKMMLQGRFATSKQRRRFEQEVEVIAGLRHPGIVTLYESGTARGGEIYFAMEFVRGATLDQWLRSVEPSPGQRVRMFADVCDAVRYAHGRGIIHRDLKPGNILIDEDGKPHVLDFGLARVNDSQVGVSGSERLETMAGEFLGTFAYASPEQLEGDPDRIDVRTDVFALGILLYEVISDERPFEMGRSLTELVHNRLECTPAPPSRHDSSIPLDLDVICLKALSVDPDRRYGSAGELEEDLRRHLDGRPILARADSTAYVLGRMVRRYKLAFGAAMFILLLAVGSAVGFGILFTRAEAKQVIAEQRLSALGDFIGLFNFYTGHGKDDLRVSEAMELMDEWAMTEYQDQPEVASTILTSVGLFHLSFDNIDRAHEVLEHVLELRAESDARERGEAHHNLGRVWMDKRDYAEAEGHYLSALDLRIMALTEMDPDVAMTLQHLGACKRKQKDFESAESFYSRAESTLVELELFDGERAARLLNSRAWLQNDRALEAGSREDFDEVQSRRLQALTMFLDAASMIRSEAAPDDFRIGRSERAIGTQLRWLDRHEEAIERYDEAIRILSTKGVESDEVLATTVDRARSMLILGRDLETTAVALGRVASAQERLARERSDPGLAEQARTTRALLVEIETALAMSVGEASGR
ncbi:MAG: serine/threonine-protein kinase [Phycisphaerales bacterium]|nr:serine/threonine-protein kinase [Phycisphaerales bacterium]